MSKKRNKRWWIIPLVVLCVIGIALLSGASYMLSYSLNPGGKEIKDSATVQWLREMYPGTVEWMDSMTNEGILRDTFITNDKGIRLHGYFAKCDSAQGTAVLAHGYTDEARRMMMLGRLYHDSLHYNIIIPDHERHGLSEGRSIQMGWLDRKNLQLWISVADSMWNYCPTVLHGISMGGATVMMCSGDSLSPSVRAIIDDCGYTSVWDEFSGEIHNQFGLPVHPLMDVASIMCDIKYGWNFHEASALNQVRKSTLPILFIHGDQDSFVPTEMVYRLYDAKTTGHKALWIAKGSAHARAYHDHPQEYLATMTAFLQQALYP